MPYALRFYLYFFVASVVIVIAVCQVALSAQERISPVDAAKYVGKSVTVCGRVALANCVVNSVGRPTYLNLNRPYPNHIFTVIIWGENRGRFPAPPEKAYSGKKICVSGTVTSFQEESQMVVTSPSQITVE